MVTAADHAYLGAETTFCISLADRPSRFGITVHNAGYRALGLNYLYKAFRPLDLASALAGVRGLRIRGCGISMPYKVAALACVDEIDPEAAAVGAINTIVNDNGRLKGYNTDIVAARQILSKVVWRAGDRVLLLGAGGVARAILHVLAAFPAVDVVIATRREDAAISLRRLRPAVWFPWARRHEVDASVLINATPIGMQPEADTTPIDAAALGRFRMVFDVVANPPISLLVAKARQQAETAVVDGLTMALYQAAEQFRLYTGRKPPLDIMRRAAEDLLLVPGSKPVEQL